MWPTSTETAHPDYALFNPTTRQTAIWYLNNRVYLVGVYGPALPSGWQLVAVGDFNGDSKPGLCPLQCEPRIKQRFGI